MKKYLMIATSAAALVGFSANAMNDGVHIGASIGYSHTNAKMKKDVAHTVGKWFQTGSTKSVQVHETFPSGKADGFLGNVYVGYHKHFGNKWTFDTRFLMSYDTSNAKVATLTHAGRLLKSVYSLITVTSNTSALKYRPDLGVGLGFYFGRQFSDKLDGYFGVVGEINFAKLKASGTSVVRGRIYTWKQTENLLVFSLTPTLGVRGMINDKMAWTGEVGYKFALNASVLNKDMNVKFKNKPNSYQAKVGVSYHF